MTFGEDLKLRVKKKANFTCCWCWDRRNKVQIHHVLPEGEGGSDDEDNAAPLCGSCHELLGGNPDLRKEMKSRRQHWYEICHRVSNPTHGWPIGLDVPELGFTREIPPNQGLPLPGIELTDKDPNDPSNPPLLYIAIHFKTSRYYGDQDPRIQERWIYLKASMRFALGLRIQVQALDLRDVQQVMLFLTNGGIKYLPSFIAEAEEPLRTQYVDSMSRGFSLHGPRADNPSIGEGDTLLGIRVDGQKRLTLSLFSPTYSEVSIDARITEEVCAKLAGYLEKIGFI